MKCIIVYRDSKHFSKPPKTCLAEAEKQNSQGLDIFGAAAYERGKKIIAVRWAVETLEPAPKAFRSERDPAADLVYEKMEEKA